jgi:hypothetical protein
MDSIGLSVGVVATHAPDGMLAFTGKRRVIDPPFSGLVTGLPKAPPEIARGLAVCVTSRCYTHSRAHTVQHEPAVPITASGLRGEQPLVNGAMGPREVGKMDA